VKDTELATQLLDGMRLLALLIGVLDDCEDMMPIDYLFACNVILEECGRFSRFLSDLLSRNSTRKVCMINWYRVAKSAELALPRAYLLLTVGQSYLQMSEEEFESCFTSCAGINSQADVINDIQAQCCAVSEPIKGLALRNAFISIIEPYLPRGNGGNWTLTLEQSIRLLLEEFSISNRLWVRLRFSAADKHDLERRQLEGIVARPILLLSTLSELNSDCYLQEVLPVLLSHVTGCRDDMAQEYLMECILEAFSIEFNWAAVEQLLDAVSKFNMTVDIRRLISAIINHILQCGGGEDSRNASRDISLDGSIIEKGLIVDAESAQALTTESLFDGLWIRIEGLLKDRVETSRAEEAILLCTPLLHRALSMAPFDADRVEKIVHFVYQSSLQSTAYTDIDKGSIIMGRIVDAVLEFVPRAKNLFEIPSIWLLLEAMKEETAASCGLALLGRMVKDQVRIKDGSEVERVKEVFSLVMKQHLHEVVDLQVIANDVIVREYAAECVFNTILIGEDGERMVDGGYLIAKAIIDSDNLLGSLVVVPKAINAWLSSQAKGSKDGNKIKTLLGDLRKATMGRQVQPIVSHSQFESSPQELQTNIGLYLHDSPSSVLVSTHGRCIEMWLTHNPDGDIIYESLVECLMVFEEEVTEHHAQCRILRSISNLFAIAKSTLAKADISVLIGTWVAHTRKLIKIDERRMLLFEMLQIMVTLAGQVESKVVLQLAKHLEPLIGPLGSEDSDSLLNTIQYNRHLIDYMLMSEPSSELGEIVYGQLCKIESTIAQKPIESPELRESIDTLLGDWQRLGAVLRPEYAQAAIIDDEPVLGMNNLVINDRPSGDDDDDEGGGGSGERGDASVFATFNPDLADFPN
jgi:hypothetical protein